MSKTSFNAFLFAMIGVLAAEALMAKTPVGELLK